MEIGNGAPFIFVGIVLLIVRKPFEKAVREFNEKYFHNKYSEEYGENTLLLVAIGTILLGVFVAFEIV